MSISLGKAARFDEPGIPPGKIITSVGRQGPNVVEALNSPNAISATTGILLELVTILSSYMDTVFTFTPPLRSIFTVVSASDISNPSARNTYVPFISVSVNYFSILSQNGDTGRPSAFFRLPGLKSPHPYLTSQGSCTNSDLTLKTLVSHSK